MVAFSFFHNIRCLTRFPAPCGCPQFLKDVHKILGSVDILGTPIKLGSSIITGVASFFYEPAKGIVHSPEAFTRGLATGTMSLIKNSMYGVFDTVSHVTGGVSKGLAALSLDDVYYQRFQSRHGTNRVRGVASPFCTVAVFVAAVACLLWALAALWLHLPLGPICSF